MYLSLFPENILIFELKSHGLSGEEPKGENQKLLPKEFWSPKHLRTQKAKHDQLVSLQTSTSFMGLSCVVPVLDWLNRTDTKHEQELKDKF